MKSLHIQRKGVMYLSEKLEVPDKLDRGMNTAAVKYHYGVNELTIHSINKIED
jgi:hypothetical protein